jgi:hypothetical protein
MSKPGFLFAVGEDVVEGGFQVLRSCESYSVANLSGGVAIGSDTTAA